MAKRKIVYKKSDKVNPMMNNTYDLGGILSGVGGVAGALPIPGAGLIGTGLQAVGNLIGGNKEEEEARKQQERMLKQQQLLSKPTPKGGIVPGVTNPYMLAYGGSLETYENGGLHNQNPLGGIPISMGADNKPNVVEEGEAAYDFEDGKYIFSNRLTFENSGNVGLPKSAGNKTFAEASKHIESLFKGRNSGIDNSTKKSLMQRLRKEQDTLKQSQEPVDNTNSFQGGGTIPFADASPYESPYNYENPLNQYLPEASTPPEYQVPGAGQNITNMAETIQENSQESWLGRNKDELLTGAGMATMGIPLITNALAKSKLEDPGVVQARTLDKELTPELVNRQQIERNLVQQLAGQKHSLAEKSGGNFGQYAANVQSMHSGSAQALANTTLQANLADAQERSRVEQGNLGIDQFNIQQQTRADEATAANQAAYQSQVSAYDQAQSQNIANIGKSLFNYGQSTQYADSMSKVMSLLGIQNKQNRNG